MRRIESRNNPKIVETAKLSARKYREETGAFFFEGAHLLEEYVRFGHVPQTVFVCDGAAEKYGKLLASLPQDVLIAVPESVFSKLSTEQAPQGLLTVSSFLPQIRSIGSADETEGRVLLLQSVRDNGNVGTVIRTAAALGWTVVLSEDCADVYAPKTVRATMGTLFSGRVRISKDPVAYALSFAQCGRDAYAATLGEQSLLLGQFPMPADACFVVGNEGQGITPELAAACKGTFLIPMTGLAESLNASVAAALIMWEGVRGR